MQTLIRGLLRGTTTEKTFGASALGGIHASQNASRFEEAVDRGNVFVVANQSTVTTQAGLSATTPALTIANRVGSGKIVKLWFVACTSLVAAGAGAAIYGCLGGYSATAVVETTAATVRNAKNGDATAPTGIACLAVATLPAAPVAVHHLGAQTTAAITTSPVGAHYERWLDGSLWIPAVYNYSIQTSTASTLFCEYIFEVQDA